METIKIRQGAFALDLLMRCLVKQHFKYFQNETKEQDKNRTTVRILSIVASNSR